MEGGKEVRQTMPTEDQVNNSWQIVEEFRCKEKKQMIYRPCSPNKSIYKPTKGRSGRVKEYSEEEIMLYKIKTLGTPESTY